MTAAHQYTGRHTTVYETMYKGTNVYYTKIAICYAEQHLCGNCIKLH
jgi:hypothetical protein